MTLAHLAVSLNIGIATLKHAKIALEIKYTIKARENAFVLFTSHS
jgi:hypothetical protein